MQLTGTLMLAMSGLLAQARAINEGGFEGNILLPRAGWKNVGCFKNAGSLTLNGTNIYQTSSLCEGLATSKSAKVIGLTQGNVCYYGNDVPTDKASDSDCSVTCVAWPNEFCGGPNAFTVWTNGDVESAAGAGSSDESSSSTAAASPSVVTASAAVVTVQNTPAADPARATITTTSSASPDSTNKPNVGGIVAGVVVGVVGAIAIFAAVFFWLRSKRHREAAAELQRQNSISGLRSEKPPSTYSMPDSRLEPAYMRRMSDGSIADNQDYSRRILKVTNPDGR